MVTPTTSYFAGSRAADTDSPEPIEISCSELRPPERTITRSGATSVMSAAGSRSSGRSGRNLRTTMLTKVPWSTWVPAVGFCDWMVLLSPGSVHSTPCCDRRLEADVVQRLHGVLLGLADDRRHRHLLGPGRDEDRDRPSSAARLRPRPAWSRTPCPRAGRSADPGTLRPASSASSWPSPRSQLRPVTSGTTTLPVATRSWIVVPWGSCDPGLGSRPDHATRADLRRVDAGSAPGRPGTPCSSRIAGRLRDELADARPGR